VEIIDELVKGRVVPFRAAAERPAADEPATAARAAQGKVAISANTLGTNNVFIFPPTGSDGRQCQHAMSARKNAVVDVRVCAPSVGSMGWTLARDIGEKITGQR
jgi:hypothetical protein